MWSYPLLTTGPKRWLSITPFTPLKNKIANLHNVITGSLKVTINNVSDISGCTVFAAAETGGRCTVVAATATYISVINYSTSKREFTVIQVLDSCPPNIAAADFS